MYPNPGHDETGDQNLSEADFGQDGKAGKAKGDGLHHHEIHQNEGGGYDSKHTHPDGREEKEYDHPTYEDARDHMDQCFGQADEGRDEGEGRSDGGDMSTDDIAGSYGRAASRD